MKRMLLAVFLAPTIIFESISVFLPGVRAGITNLLIAKSPYIVRAY